MALDLTSLKMALSSLERAVRVASVEIRGSVNTEKEHVIQAGVIQNFEFTYEVCWKFMKRWLETNSVSRDVDGASRKVLFRMAAESGLISNVESWLRYHHSRNEMAHLYNAQKADEVYASALLFLDDAKDFLQRLETKND